MNSNNDLAGDPPILMETSQEEIDRLFPNSAALRKLFETVSGKEPVDNPPKDISWPVADSLTLH